MWGQIQIGKSRQRRHHVASYDLPRQADRPLLCSHRAVHDPLAQLAVFGALRKPASGSNPPGWPINRIKLALFHETTLLGAADFFKQSGDR